MNFVRFEKINFFSNNFGKIKIINPTIFLTSILLFTISVYSQNLCSLKIADSLINSFNGNEIIYNYGRIDEVRFSKDAGFPYTVPFAKEIDFFYATEFHGPNHQKNHETLV